jgi:predicted HTH transcriptional regulator
MLNIIHNNDSFWEKIINSIIARTECKYWDFKQTLEMWKAASSLKQMKQIDFCEKIAAFANRKGGIIFIGIGDKIPRKTMGVSDLENKLQSINMILNKWIEYQEDFYSIEEIILKDSDGIKKRCIAVIIAQTGDPVGVKNKNGFYSYPVRLETGLYRENLSRIKKKKKAVINTNFNFLNLLNNNH